MAPHKWYCNGRESGLVRSGVACRCQPLGLKCWPFRCLEPIDNSEAQHTSKMIIEKHSGVRWYNACHLCALLSCWSSSGSTTKECHHYFQSQDPESIFHCYFNMTRMVQTNNWFMCIGPIVFTVYQWKNVERMEFVSACSSSFDLISVWTSGPWMISRWIKARS